MVRLPQLADLFFGHGAALSAVDEVNTTLVSWRTSAHTIEWQVTNATLDLLITCGSPRLEDVQEAQLVQLVAEYPPGTGRRNGLFKVSRVLAHKGIISAPLTSNHRLRGPFQETLDSAPGEWLEWALRWHRISTHEPSTVRGMFSTILVAGRWAAEKHPDRIGPDKWTRDMAAEYVADTMSATMGQWAGVNRNRTRWGQPLSAVGKAQRMDTLRSFFSDLIRMGVDLSPVRPKACAQPAALDTGTDRAEPAHHRRRCLGEARGGRAHAQCRRSEWPWHRGCSSGWA